MRQPLVLAIVLALCPAAVRAQAPVNNPPQPPSPVTYRNEVMAVISKAGCNLGTCHGNATGKGGFKISLRGEDLPGDLEIFTRDHFSRRINPLRPDESLLLLKAVAAVPHEGGKRFSRDSAEYAILRAWIAAGARGDETGVAKLEKLIVSPTSQVLIEPNDQLQLRVEARFSDGTQRDVTALTVFEPVNRSVTVSHDGMISREQMGETTVLARYLNKQTPVRVTFLPKRDFTWDAPPPVNYVDEHVFAKLQALRVNPSPACSDEVFLRRAHLDLLGVPPTVAETRAFLADGAEDKRAKLVEQLLQRPEFAEFWALKWADLLRLEERTLDRKGVQAFHQWIRHSIATNKPLDQFARELVSARGSTYDHPPANFYRANRDAVTRAEAAAQVFLGIRLQCAKCHNHPFDRWTQDDYYNWAGFFARVDYKIVENRRRDKNDSHEFDGEQIVFMTRTGEMTDPRNGQAAKPRFLGSSTPELGPDDDRLEVLARWLTDASKSPQFARMQVNRVWFHLLGRGIVDPIDDFRATNPPANPQLLTALADDFVKNGYDLRRLIRTIMASRVYQLSAEPNASNSGDETNFSHAYVRPLAAEQLLDAIRQATGVTLKFAGYPAGLRAGQIPGVSTVRPKEGSASDGDQFLKLFGKPPRLLTCECERSSDTTLSQTFQMISGPLLNDLLTRSDNRLSELLAARRAPAEMIDELYLAVLCRRPTEEEAKATTAMVAAARDPRAALEDVLWGLLNAKEFLLRQ